MHERYAYLEDNALPFCLVTTTMGGCHGWLHINANSQNTQTPQTRKEEKNGTKPATHTQKKKVNTKAKKVLAKVRSRSLAHLTK